MLFKHVTILTSLLCLLISPSVYGEVQPESVESERRPYGWRLDVGGGVQDFNYASDAPVFFIEGVYKEPKRFYLMGGLRYTDKFTDEAVAGKIGAGFHVHPRIVISDEITFSSGRTSVPQFSNQFQVEGYWGNFEPYLRHTFRHYQIADINIITPGIRWYARPWFLIDAWYSLSIQNLQGLPSGRLDNYAFTRWTFIPFEDQFKFFLLYGWGSESFDAESGQQFGRFNSHTVGGGFEWKVYRGYGLRFYSTYENRNNGQTVQDYIGALFYEF